MNLGAVHPTTAEMPFKGPLRPVLRPITQTLSRHRILAKSSAIMSGANLFFLLAR
jgi:hypothetical protein